MLLELANMGHSFVISSICGDHDKGLSTLWGGRRLWAIIDGVFWDRRASQENGLVI